jgi:hypothetical protein
MYSWIYVVSKKFERGGISGLALAKISGHRIIRSLVDRNIHPWTATYTSLIL